MKCHRTAFNGRSARVPFYHRDFPHHPRVDCLPSADGIGREGPAGYHGRAMVSFSEYEERSRTAETRLSQLKEGL